MKRLIIIILTNILSIYGYTQIPLYRHWNCIGTSKSIKIDKPYTFNVGDIPLIAWKAKNNTAFATLNICKHFGSKLDDGWIENDCLVCPYHGLRHGYNERCGDIINYDGKIWWAFNPINDLPPKIPYNSEEFQISHIEVDMDEDMPFCMYNAMDINHAEYIHNGIFGFGSKIPIKNYTHINNNNQIIGASFEHHIKKNIKLLNKNFKVGDDLYTKNYHEFIYPSTTWSVVQQGNINKLVVGVSMTPISTTKTKWIITLKHNYMKDIFSTELLKFATKQIIGQDKKQFKRQVKNKLLKDNFTFKRDLSYENHMNEMYKLFKNYNYPLLKDFIIDLNKNNW